MLESVSRLKLLNGSVRLRTTTPAVRRLTGVELRLRCCRCMMSGVLDVTLQRSEQRWWAWWAHRVRGLAEAERGQSGESEQGWGGGGGRKRRM